MESIQPLTVSGSRDYFLRGGKRFFYLADTVWNVFSDSTLEEWEEYLEYRMMQGFNALQMSVMPIWNDCSLSGLECWPFLMKENHKYDFNKLNEAYFDKAEKMVRMAVSRGFVPALILLWLCYVKDTQSIPYDEEWVMPMEVVQTYSEYVVKRFSKYKPVFIISGDTNFGSEHTVEYYMTALKTVKSLYPEGITSMHIAGNMRDLPEVFVQSPFLDFYMYQSGHSLDEQQNAYKYAENFYAKKEKRPIVNAEFCYEGSYNGVCRYGSCDIRKAAWQSLMSGAKAGVTYGAHGIWNWHHKGTKFFNEAWSITPYDWKTAMKLDGSWDFAFAKWVFEVYDLFEVKPAEILLNKKEEIRASMSEDGKRVAIYIPYSVDIRLFMDCIGFDWVMVDLTRRLPVKPVVLVENGCTTLKMADFNSDFLIVGRS